MSAIHRCFYRLTHSSQPILVKPISSGSMSTIAFPSVNPAVIVSLIVPPRPLSRSQEQKGLLNETFSSLLDTYVPASISTPTSHVPLPKHLGNSFPDISLSVVLVITSCCDALSCASSAFTESSCARKSSISSEELLQPSDSTIEPKRMHVAVKRITFTVTL